MLQILGEHYGWRGTTLITGSIILNMCVLGLMMKSPARSNTTSDAFKKRSTTTVFNFKVFRNIHFLLFLLSNSFFFCGHSVMSVHLPSHAMILGMEQYQAAHLISIMGLANFAGRIIGGLLSLLHQISSMSVFVCSVIMCAISTMLCPLAYNYILITSYAGVFGLLVGCLCVKLPSVIIQILDVSLLATGYGCMLLFESVGTLLGAPLAGNTHSCNNTS